MTLRCPAGVIACQNAQPGCLCECGGHFCPTDHGCAGTIGLINELTTFRGSRLGDVLLDQRAGVQVDDHSRSSTSSSATLRLRRVRATGGSGPSFLPLHCSKPA